VKCDVLWGGSEIPERISCVRSQGKEVGTGVTCCSILNVTGKAVTDKEMHQQRTTPTGFQ
jgi:hypothetical protein